ncbi:hypothetical protein [Desulfonatronum lacustre]|uniref:hypothetical protein n=1 Tax=Desulfonatronum lacustre TaxID=66849 RepID=UPI00048C61DB|nr:hypothetical protein [Desulfonatronum lacustre]
MKLPFLFASPFVLANIGGWKPFYEKHSNHFMPFDIHFSQDIISFYVYEANIGIVRHSYYFNSPTTSSLILALSFIFFIIIVFYPMFNMYEIQIKNVETERKSYVETEIKSFVEKDISNQKKISGVIKNIFYGKIDTTNNRYRELVVMVSGDKHAAERLINLEASKHPDKMRLEVIDIAIARLLRDRH